MASQEELSFLPLVVNTPHPMVVREQIVGSRALPFGEWREREGGIYIHGGRPS